MNIHLVDGTYELFRAHFGAPAARAPDGTEVGATRGFARSLLALLDRREVSHVAVAFDRVVESFRNDLFGGYKTGEGIEPELLAQFPLAEEAASALGVVVWPMIEFEADDAIATAALRFRDDPRVEQILLCSPDKDLAQCVLGRKVVLWDRRRKTVYDRAGVREKWGVEPDSMPDWLALVGDAADGIPGIPRWGAKSSALVLARFGHVEDIPHDEAEWDVRVRAAGALAESLRAHRREVVLYKTLATLRTDAPIGESLDELRWRGVRRRRLEALCERLGDERLTAPPRPRSR